MDRTTKHPRRAANPPYERSRSVSAQSAWDGAPPKGHSKSKKSASVHNHDVRFTLDGSAIGFPTQTQFQACLEKYLEELHPKKRGKALITQETFEAINRVLLNPTNSHLYTAQFRFWVRKMFNLESANGKNIITHEDRPVAIMDQLYSILVQCHDECGHGGRDKTVKEIKKYYSYIPKPIIALFVRVCPSCSSRQFIHDDEDGIPGISRPAFKRANVPVITRAIRKRSPKQQEVSSDSDRDEDEAESEDERVGGDDDEWQPVNAPKSSLPENAPKPSPPLRRQPDDASHGVDPTRNARDRFDYQIPYFPPFNPNEPTLQVVADNAPLPPPNPKYGMHARSNSGDDFFAYRAVDGVELVSPSEGQSDYGFGSAYEAGLTPLEETLIEVDANRNRSKSDGAETGVGALVGLMAGSSASIGQGFAGVPIGVSPPESIEFRHPDIQIDPSLMDLQDQSAPLHQPREELSLLEPEVSHSATNQGEEFRLPSFFDYALSTHVQGHRPPTATTSVSGFTRNKPALPSLVIPTISVSQRPPSLNLYHNNFVFYRHANDSSGLLTPLSGPISSTSSYSSYSASLASDDGSFPFSPQRSPTSSQNSSLEPSPVTGNLLLENLVLGEDKDGAQSGAADGGTHEMIIDTTVEPVLGVAEVFGAE